MTHCKSRYECVFVYEFEYLPTYLPTHVFVTLSVEAYRAKINEILCHLIPTRKAKVRRNLSTYAQFAVVNLRFGKWNCVYEREREATWVSEIDTDSERVCVWERDIVRLLIIIGCLGVNSRCQNQSEVRERRKFLGEINQTLFSFNS